MATQQMFVPPQSRERRGSGALDPDTQQQVAELNLRGLTLICAVLDAAGVRPGPVGGMPARRGRAAAHSRAAELPPAVAAARAGAGERRAPTGALPAVLDELGSDWLSLDAAARGRLAACPYLLFELALGEVLAAPVAGVFSSSGASVQEGRRSPVALVRPPFAAAEGLGLARLLLHYAWHLVRAAPAAATLVLGVPLSMVVQLQTLSLSEVDLLGDRAAPWMRLRWDDDPVFWAAWLAAAAANDPAALWQAQLRGLQRIAGTCRALHPVPP